MMYLKRMAVLTYVTVMLFLSCFILMYALHFISLDVVISSLAFIYTNENLRIAVGIIAAALLLVNFFYYYFFSVNVHREKMIAFDNPTGRVTVSLIAMEDLIRRVVSKIVEVKGCKPIIKATRKGLDIKIKLVISSEASIPDVTGQVQRMVSKKIQETISLDEPINIEIYVGKIVAESIKGRSQTGKSEEKPELTVPFHGYRA